jgi:hypothetical protein
MSSGGSSLRSRATTRYHPSPNGATRANASPVELIVSASAGGWLNRTSASITDRTTDLPGNGIPRARRTVL